MKEGRIKQSRQNSRWIHLVRRYCYMVLKEKGELLVKQGRLTEIIIA